MGDSVKLNMKRILSKLKKINFTSIMFFVFSLISATFAWFAFSNIVDNDMQIDIKAWKVDISEGDSLITNKLEIEIPDFYPGNEMVAKEITISNEGDISSVVSYKISSLRILDEEFDVSNQDILFDNLAQIYPFTINFNLDKEFLEIGDEAVFSYSIVWPLDSGDDNADAQWGNRSYDFLVAEQAKKNQDNSYQIRSSISITIDLLVEQFVDNGTNVVDEMYSFGTSKRLNMENYDSCIISEPDCLRFYVIENENKKSMTTVKMMADPTAQFTHSDYASATGTIDAISLMDIISSDIVNTQIVRPGYSNRILGKANDKSYYTSILEYMNETDAYIIFDMNEFPMFLSGDCYWVSNAQYPNLVVDYFGGTTLQLHFKKENWCMSVPVIDYTK